MVAHSKSKVLDPDRNPILRSTIKHTIYKQFCAGTNAQEVRTTLNQLKGMGFTGAILGYAREVVMDENEVNVMNNEQTSEGQTAKENEEVSAWETGTLKTIEMAEPGDFVALKFTGAGNKSLAHLMKNIPPSPTLNEAIMNMCERARDGGVRLLFDAEQAALQDGIDAWTVDFMQRYNRPSNPDGGRALVYGTYQAYRTSTPGTIANHMQMAKEGGWRLGVKLVRGAYLGSDPRHLFWPNKQATDNAYDSIAQSLMQRKFGDILRPSKDVDEEFPEVDLVLAGHNSHSVNKAMAVRDQQTLNGNEKTEMVYAQLMGMADHVSCALIQKSRRIKENEEKGVAAGDEPKTFKYIVWGTVGECTKYLLRRAQENRDAVERTVEGRRALGQELARRFRLRKTE
ncbi:putative proline oxidase [Phaeomoniella chlamydospora]|uniref:Proline dehydrogenase n=1 Tax=Phaeomoniella chlamydospora TaxID=158046 RepID=A0A0G2EQB1_PHACM|nr:putative proline oxidase [Phaeomoniella chlamydospora]